MAKKQKKEQSYLIKALILFVGGVCIGYFLGYGNSPKKTHMEHTHNEHMAHGTHMHTHDQLEATYPIPSVSLSVTEDPKSGWNAYITTTNFTFAPERASTAHIPGEGHAHIYINGKKINRIYSNWYHLGELDHGTHEVSVRLSTNDHQELVSGGTPISATQTVVVEKQ